MVGASGVMAVAVQRGLNPGKTLVGLAGLSGKHLGNGRRRVRARRFEEREMERRVLAVPPMAFQFLQVQLPPFARI